MKITLVHPSRFKLDGGAMFGIIPKPLWSKKILADDQNRIDMSLRVVLIETKNRKILIDTGIGDYHPEKFTQQFAITNSKLNLGSIIESSLNIPPDQITDIILTHLHFDHVGGLGTGASGTELIFKNATIHLHQDHHKYAKNSTLRDRGSFQSHYFEPLLEKYLERDQIHYLSAEQGQILHDGPEEVEFLTSFGHTPHMIHPIFSGHIYMADLVPMAHHIRLPWVMGYDIEPGVTTVYKEKFYQKIMDEKLTMIFEHDIETWGGQLELNEKGQFNLKPIGNTLNHDTLTYPVNYRID